MVKLNVELKPLNAKDNESDSSEAVDLTIPDHVRREYAVKVWSLLAFQMNSAFVVAILFEAAAPWVSDISKRVMIWLGWCVATLIILAIVRHFRKKTPINYILLAIGTLFSGSFFGITKYIAHNLFGINLLGQVTMSLTLSAVLHYFQITETLGKKLQPKRKIPNSNTQVKQPMSVIPQQAPDQKKAWGTEGSASGPVKNHSSKMEKKRSSVAAVLAHAVMDRQTKDDGFLRATMLLAVFTWFAAAITNLVIMMGFKQLDDMQISEVANPVSVAAAAAASFFILAFFHYDCERHMRKCNVDEYMSVVINVNSDLIFMILILYAIAAILACNEESVEFSQEYGGGGGGGGAPMDEGGMEGGAAADAPADAAEPEPDVDRVYGGDGI